jgi:SHS2 domain-containing protein
MSWRFADELATSDAAFVAEGASLLEVLRSAVDATLAVMIGDPGTVQALRTVRLRIQAEDPAGLLFELLQEIIYRKDAERLLLRLGDGAVEEGPGSFALEAMLVGEPLDARRHEAGTDVKAVTLQGFEVVRADGGWSAQVVLDV